MPVSKDDTMYMKGNKWFSDFTDADGKRRRKSHNTQLAARRHEEKMKREQAARPIAAVARMTTSPSPSKP